MLALAPRALPAASPLDRPQVFPAEGERRKRVALLTGCAQRVLDTGDQRRDDPAPHPARLRGGGGRGRRLLRGADASHGQGRGRAMPRRRRTSAPGCARCDGAGLDAVVVNTSGCGTTVKDYGHMFAGEPLAADAARVAGLARDVTEVMAELGLAAGGGGAAAAGRLSRRLLAAARPAGPDAAEGAAQGGGLRGGRAARQPSLLRLGRHLQPAAAGDLGRAPRRARWRRWRRRRRR